MKQLDPEARALLRTSRSGDQPSAEDRARMRSKVLAALIAESASSAQPAHAPRGASRALGASGKLIGLAIVAITAASAVIWSQARIGRRPTAMPRTLAPSAQVIVQAPAPNAVIPPAAEPASPTTTVSVPVRSSARLRSAKVIQPAQVVRAVPAAPPESVEAESQSATGAAPTEAPNAPVPNAQALPGAPAAMTESAAVAPASSARPARPRDVLGEELALISAAQSALRAGDTTRAFALLQQHAQRFPGGALTQERLATQALASCSAGRYADGQRAIEQLALAAPNSPWLAGARRSCISPRPHATAR
jgi:hypothetical protein